MRRSTYICSISPIGHKKTFPGSLSYYVRQSEGAEQEIRARKSTTFTIPPVAKSEWVVLQVFDSAQMITNTSLITDETSIRPDMPAPQSAQVLAQSMILDWTSTPGATGSSSLGIGVIAGPEPTAAELSDLIRKQESLFAQLVQIADDFERKGQAVNINNFHRKAAAWLGVDRDWHRGVTYTETKHCINCGEQIKARSRGCKECGTNLVDYAIENDIPAAELKANDPFVAAIVTSKRKQKAMRGKNTAPPEVDEPTED
jgi:hypothetical protein